MISALQAFRNKISGPLGLAAIAIVAAILISLAVNPNLENRENVRWVSYGDMLALGYFAVSLGFLYVVVRKPREVEISGKFLNYLSLGALLVLLGLIGSRITGTELTKHFSDMSPIMEVMAERLVSGQDPYLPIAEIWDGIEPIYLPGFWVHFSLAQLLQIDVRWATFLLLAFTLFVLWREAGTVGLYGRLAFLFLLVFLFVVLFSYPAFFTQIPELTPICYYTLLVVCLLRRPTSWAVPLLLSLCVLSRYSFLMWLPTLALFFYKQYGWRALGRVVGASALFSVGLLLVTRAHLHLGYLLSVPGQYYKDIGNPLNADTYAHLLYDFLGLVRFFYPTHLALTKLVVFASALISPLVYLYFKGRSVRPGLALVAALYFSLVVFYNFLVGPYLYLFFIFPFLMVALFIGACASPQRGS